MEPTKLPAPPRRVTGGEGVGLWIFRAVTLSLILLAVWALGYLLMAILWATSGKDVPGEVTGMEVRAGTKPVHFVFLRYETSAGTKNGRVSVDAGMYEMIERVGRKPLRVRYYALAGFHVWGLPATESKWSKTGTAGVMAFLAIALAFIFYWISFMVPARVKRMIRLGIATPGVVTDKQAIRANKAMVHKAMYVYDGPSGARHAGQCVVLQGAWEKITIGETVTVLMDPAKEKKSIVYEWTDYKVVS